MTNQRMLVPSIITGKSTCDVMLFEGIAVDLVLIGTVFLQPFAHILLGPQGHWLGQLHISWLLNRKKDFTLHYLQYFFSFLLYLMYRTVYSVP